jgi:sec-independent protein translocase protein TatA
MDFGFKELLVILIIALVLFGGKRVKSLGSDLGTAIRGFRKAMKESEGESDAQAQVIEHAAEPRQNHPT